MIDRNDEMSEVSNSYCNSVVVEVPVLDEWPVSIDMVDELPQCKLAARI